jgi:hypothetical protein
MDHASPRVFGRLRQILNPDYFLCDPLLCFFVTEENAVPVSDLLQDSHLLRWGVSEREVAAACAQLNYEVLREQFDQSHVRLPFRVLLNQLVLTVHDLPVSEPELRKFLMRLHGPDGMSLEPGRSPGEFIVHFTSPRELFALWRALGAISFNGEILSTRMNSEAQFGARMIGQKKGRGGRRSMFGNPE